MCVPVPGYSGTGYNVPPSVTYYSRSIRYFGTVNFLTSDTYMNTGCADVFISISIYTSVFLRHTYVYTHIHYMHTCMFNTTYSTGVPGVHTRVPGNSKFVVRDDF